MFRGAGFVAWADVKNMLRGRETLLWVFVMPFVFFYFIGTVTGGFGSARGRPDRPDPLVVEAPADGGPLLDLLVRKLEAQNFRVDRRAAAPGDATPGAPASTADDSTIPDRLLIVPAAKDGRGFTDAVVAGEVHRLTYRTRAEGSVAELERIRVMRARSTAWSPIRGGGERGAPADADTLRAVERAPRHVTLSVQSAGRRVRAPQGFAQAIPGTLVMFTMLVSLTSGAVLLVVERRLGLLRRLAAAPIARSAVVGGKWMARLALAFVQIAFAMITGTVVFRMDWGGSVPMVLVLLAAWAGFNASLALLVGSLARTEGQTIGLGVLSTMALAALGGCWWPIEITPRWMQALAMALPTGWAMDAMHRLVSFGNPASAALPHVLGLATGSVVLGWLATRAFRYD